MSRRSCTTCVASSSVIFMSGSLSGASSGGGGRERCFRIHVVAGGCGVERGEALRRPAWDHEHGVGRGRADVVANATAGAGLGHNHRDSLVRLHRVRAPDSARTQTVQNEV